MRPEFASRSGKPDNAHIRTLAQAVKSHGPLDPMLLWQDAGDLVLLDGAYRLAAYKVAGWRGTVPVMIVSCDRRTALLLAAGANAKDKLSLTYAEKADLAWKLVREPGMDFSKPEIAKATGTSTATVGRMRARFKALLKVPDTEITGHWWRDQKDDAAEWMNTAEMSEAQRLVAVAEVAKQLRDILDWRKPGSPTWESSFVFEALSEAIGLPKCREFADWLFGGREEEVDEWGGFSLDSGEEADEQGSDAERF